MKGHALIVGVTEVDSTHYAKELSLKVAENDTKFIEDIINESGEHYDLYNGKPLVGSDAKWSNIKGFFDRLNPETNTEETYVLIYISCHGGLVMNHKEEKRNILCLYDEIILENELHKKLDDLGEKFKVCVIVDACYSGGLNSISELYDVVDLPDNNQYKVTDVPLIGKTFIKRCKHYNEKIKSEWNYKLMTEAQVCFLFASQNNETASINNEYSTYTQALNEVWDNGNFDGSYFEFQNEIDSKINDERQNPKIDFYPLYIPKEKNYFKNYLPFKYSKTHSIKYTLKSSTHSVFTLSITNETKGQKIKIKVENNGANFKLVMPGKLQKCSELDSEVVTYLNGQGEICGENDLIALVDVEEDLSSSKTFIEQNIGAMESDDDSDTRNNNGIIILRIDENGSKKSVKHCRTKGRVKNIKPSGVFNLPEKFFENCP